MTEQNQQNSLLGKIAAYTEILAKDPKSTIFVSLSEAYRKMGMLDDASQVVNKGLESHPDFSPAHIVLARILCQQGEYSASEDSFKKALESDPESLAALVGYARLNILLGKESAARALLLDARKLSPADPVINKLLLSLPEDAVVETVAETVIPATEPEDEQQEYLVEEEPREEQGVPESNALPLASATLAELYRKQGLTEQALNVYRQLSTKDPDNLLFRRKIRDLEDGNLESEDGQDAFDARDSDDAEIEIEAEEALGSLPNEEVELTPEPLDAVIETTQGNIDQPQDDEKVLATLNRWLDSIQQRREDV